MAVQIRVDRPAGQEGQGCPRRLGQVPEWLTLPETNGQVAHLFCMVSLERDGFRHSQTPWGKLSEDVQNAWKVIGTDWF